MNIFEMAELDCSTLEDRIEQTLDIHPILRKIYDAEFKKYTSRRRNALDNYLLVLLINPQSPMTRAFWREVSCDLVLLRPEESLKHFSPKFRQLERVAIESAKTELELSAWAKRHFGSVVLEPAVPGTTRLCDFSANTGQITWWEIKSILDTASVREQDKLQLRVQAAFRNIPEPFVLNLERCETKPAEIDAAIRDIRRQLRSLNTDTEPTLPQQIESNGLVIDVATRSGLGFGYIGTLGAAFMFKDENFSRVRECIEIARRQLPPGGPGIVVIDRTVTTWIDEQDILEACFGEEKLVGYRGRLYRARDTGVFRPDVNTRLSAVMSIERWNDGEVLSRRMTLYHNPYAASAINSDIFQQTDVRQWTSLKQSDGRYWPEKLG